MTHPRTATAASIQTVGLSPAVHKTALADNEVYERVYSELLGEPTSVAAQDRFVESLGLNGDSADLRRGGSAVLGRLLPPTRLRQVTEVVVDETIAYLRGDRERVEPPDGVRYVIERIAHRTGHDLDSITANIDLAAYERLLRLVQRDLDRGELTDLMSQINLSRDDLDTLADDVIDGLSALQLAMQRDLGAHGATAHQRTGVAGDVRLPAVDTLFVGLNRIRDHVRIVPIGFALGVGLMLTATAMIRRRRRGLAFTRWTATTLAFAGIALLIVTRMVITPRLVSAAHTATGDLTSFAALSLVDDVSGSLVDAITEPLEIVAIGSVAAGVAVVALWETRIGRRDRGRHTAATAVAAALFVSTTSVGVPSPNASRPSRICNGHTELCGRTFDSVTFAATHNSMSSSVDGFWFPFQDIGIRAQLDLGIRALLIDSHSWQPALHEEDLRRLRQSLPAEIRDELAGALDQLGETRPGTYLCHRHCALGAVDMTAQLAEIEAFLAERPDEVLTLIIQDGIGPDDTRAAFDAADLTGQIYHHRQGRPWPTLSELIDDGRRLVVFEESRPGVGGHTVDHIQETPYHVEHPAELTCQPNRGGARNDLFLMNHWIERLVPDRADAAVLNDTDAIVERVSACAGERGVRPTFVAVNFATIGNIVEATNIINGVDQ